MVPNFSVWSRRARSMCAPENYLYVASCRWDGVAVAVVVAVNNKQQQQQQHQNKKTSNQKHRQKRRRGGRLSVFFYLPVARCVGSGKPKWRFGSASCVGCVGCMYCTEVCMSLTGRRTTKSNRWRHSPE